MKGGPARTTTRSDSRTLRCPTVAGRRAAATLPARTEPAALRPDHPSTPVAYCEHVLDVAVSAGLVLPENTGEKVPAEEQTAR
ncbi:hypothetical protein [Kitasatospora sp. NPDC091276]|uniref:hypothetical protein n=1 Tax=unclassified Kitasatospora TaxID=2633591 RepID=UPI00341D9885